MSQVLEGIDGVEAIVDDILLWRRDIQEHDARLKRVVDRVQDVNLRLNQNKLPNQKRRNCLCWSISNKGWSDPEKVRAVQAMTKPSNMKELKTF